MATLFLDRESGRIAYDVRGSGPLVICAPGMGDIRQTFRHIVPALVAAGHRVATFDLRGHGESDTTFARFDDRRKPPTSSRWPSTSARPRPWSSETRWVPRAAVVAATRSGRS